MPKKYSFTCLNCETEHKDKPGSAKYCNNKCQSDHEFKCRVQNWKDGGEISDRVLKRYLSEKNYSCFVCGISEWNKKEIVLELEHKDGNSDNNDEENVCLLCPNCHSQTPTFKGRNAGKGRHTKRTRMRSERYAAGKSY